MRLFENPPRCYGPAVLFALAAVAGAGATLAATNAGQAKAQTMATPQATGTQIVDPAKANANNLGRAALIATSPQGVQGTNTSARYKLLGNVTGLGNS